MASEASEEQRETGALIDHAVTTKDDLFALLTLTYDASDPSTSPTQQQISKAWKRAALLHHPDKNPGHEKEAADRLDRCRQAYNTLSNPEARARYEARRRSELEKARRSEAFEGRRRKMRDDLERRESSGNGLFAGTKRASDGDDRERELKRLAAEGARKRAEREERLRRQREDDEDFEAARRSMRASTGSAATAAADGERPATPSFSTPQPKKAPGFSFSPRPAGGGGGGDSKSPAMKGGALYEKTMARLREAERKRAEAEIRRKEAAEGAGADGVTAEG